MVDGVVGARTLNRLCNILLYSRGLIVWTMFWVGFTTFMVMRQAAPYRHIYESHRKQIGHDHGPLPPLQQPGRLTPSSALSGMKRQLQTQRSDMSSIHTTLSISNTNVESSGDATLSVSDVNTPSVSYLNTTSGKNMTKIVADPKNICSRPVQGRRGKENCMSLDLLKCSWLDGNMTNDTALPLGPNVYLLRNLTHFRNISKLLPDERVGAMYKANVVFSYQGAGRMQTVVFLASFGNSETRRITETREKGVFLLNKILGLNHFPQTFQSRSFPAWTRNLIHPSRRGAVGNSMRLLLYSLNNKPLSNENNYNTYLLLLYLSKCALPVVFYSYETYQRTNYVLDAYSCFLKENQTDFIAAKRLLSLKSYLMDKEMICKLPERIFTLLRQSDDITTKSPTIGQRLMELFLSYNETSTFFLSASEEVDGRVSEVLYWHKENCFNNTTEYMQQEPNRHFLKVGPVANVTVLDRHNGSKVMFIAKYKNGETAYFKQLHVCHSDFLGEGARELLAYYVDRALGLDRSPSIVVRQFYFKDTYPYSIYQNNATKQILINITEAVFIKHFRRKIREDSEGRKIMDFIFIGEIKDMERLAVRTDELIEILFQKTIDGSSAPGHRSITRQTLRDISSILIYDFIIHNWDRMGDNWIRSSLRTTPFDAGNSWYDIKDTAGLVCQRLLQFPIVPGDPVHLPNVAKLDIPMLDRNVLASCNSVRPDYQLCRFDKDMVEKVRRHGKDIVPRVKDMIRADDTGFVECLELDKFKIFEGIQERVDYLLKYIDACYQKLGDKMYL